MTHPDLHPAPLAPEITQPVTGQQINQLDEQANEQPLSYLTMTAEEHQLQQEHGDHFDLSDHRLYELKHHQEAYAKELAAREGSSYQLKGKSGVSQTEQAYAKAVFALAEARSVETDATKIDAYGNKQAHYDSRKATREALFILLGSSAPDGQLEGDGQLFSLTDAKHDQRLLRTGRYEKGLGGVEEIESGKFRRALNSCYDKWGEWSQQGVRGFAKKAAAGAAAGLLIGAAGAAAAVGTPIGAAGAAAVGIAGGRLIKGGASLKMNKKAREGHLKVAADRDAQLSRLDSLVQNTSHGYGLKEGFIGDSTLDYDKLKSNVVNLIGEQFTGKANKEHRRNFIGTAVGTVATVAGGTAAGLLHNHFGDVMDWIGNRGHDITGAGAPSLVTARPDGGIPTPGPKIEAPTTGPAVPKPTTPLSLDTKHGDVLDGFGTQSPATGPSSIPHGPNVDNGTGNARDGYSGVRTPAPKTTGPSAIPQGPNVDHGTGNARVDQFDNPINTAHAPLIQGPNTIHGDALDGNTGTPKPAAPTGPSAIPHGPNVDNGTSNPRVDELNNPKPDTAHAPKIDNSNSNPRDGQSGVPSKPNTPATGDTGKNPFSLMGEQPNAEVKTIKLGDIHNAAPAKLYSEQLGAKDGYRQMLEDAKKAINSGDLKQVKTADGRHFFYQLTTKGAQKFGLGANSSRSQDVMQVLGSFSDKLKVSR